MKSSVRVQPKPRRGSARDLIAMVNLAAASLNPLLMAVHPVPKAALMPIIMLWLGINDAPKLLVIRWAWLYRLFITIQVNSDSLRRIPVEL
jgi:ABC-type nitrate/sulfonate/bicarbonate transport system permease component